MTPGGNPVARHTTILEKLVSIFDLVNIGECADQYEASIIDSSLISSRGSSAALRDHITQRVCDFLWAAQGTGDASVNWIAKHQGNIGHMLFLSQQGIDEPFHVEGHPSLEALASGAPFTELTVNGAGLLELAD